MPTTPDSPSVTLARPADFMALQTSVHGRPSLAARSGWPAAALLLLACACSGHPSIPRPASDFGSDERRPSGRSSVSLVEPPGGRFLKRSVAVTEFANTTPYGNDGADGPEALGRQVAHNVTSRLAATQKFLPFDPGQDPEAPASPYEVTGTLSRLDPGGPAESDNEAAQDAVAAIQVQIISRTTGRVVFATVGHSAAAPLLSDGVAEIDAALSHKLISAAIASVMDELVEQLLEDPWTTSVLLVYGTTCVISGGHSHGLRIGDHLVVLERPKSIVDPGTGEDRPRAPRQLARVEIESSFGHTAAGEASICKVISGDLEECCPAELIVQQSASVRLH